MADLIRFSFVGGNDPESGLIKLFEHGPWSHVDCVLPDNSRLGARLDGGVRVRPPGYENFAREQIIELPTSPEQFKAWLGFITSQVGHGYDKAAIAAFAVDQNWSTPGLWICSGLGTASTMPAYVSPSFFSKNLEHPPEQVTPWWLYLMLDPHRLGA